MPPLKIALAQILVQGGDLSANLARAHSAIQRAAAEHCHIIVLPETLDLGWMHQSAAHLAAPIPGPTSDLFATWAQKYRLYIAAGLTESIPSATPAAPDRIYNSAILLSPEGQLLRRHRKINEMVAGQSYYSLGTDLAVTPTPLGNIGLNICADLTASAPGIGQAQGHMRAQLLLSPAVWCVPTDFDQQKTPYGDWWRNGYIALAKKFQLAIIGVSNVGLLTEGEWANRPCIGNSIAIGPEGQLLAELPFNQEAFQTVETTLIPRPLINW